MPKVAAIEFEDNLARVLVARTSGSSFQLSSAFEVELESNWEDDSDFGKNLASALGNQIGRCDTLVSFARGQSEIRVINVPVVPDDELPEIVRFQAIRQFTNALEDSPVDFLPLSETADEKRVLAATVPLSAVEKLKTGCQTAGLNVKEIKLRATCTTALSQSIDSERKNYIIVEADDKSFNLEVVAYGKLCLTRTVRATSGETSVQIIREIRRTLAAANNQIQGYEARQVVVFGEEKDFDGLRSAIENELQFDVDFINPFDHASGLSSPPAKSGEYASLVGLLTSHCKSTTETIDFLNPRRKTTEGGQSRKMILIGAVAATFFIALIAGAYLILAAESSKIAKIQEEIKSKENSDKIAKEIIGDVEKIESFENSQANWLKELANLSECLMDPDRVILNSANFFLDLNAKTAGVKIETNGYLQSGDISEKIGTRIRLNDKYEATLEDVMLLSQKEKDQDIYSHKFTARIYRSPELLIPEYSPDDFDKYMAPRIEVGKKNLELAKKAAEEQDGNLNVSTENGQDQSKDEDQKKELSNE